MRNKCAECGEEKTLNDFVMSIGQGFSVHGPIVCNGCLGYEKCAHCSLWKLVLVWFRPGQDFCKPCQKAWCSSCCTWLHQGRFRISDAHYFFESSRPISCTRCLRDGPLKCKGQPSSTDKTKRILKCIDCWDWLPLSAFRRSGNSRKDVCRGCELLYCSACRSTKQQRCFRDAVSKNVLKHINQPSVCVQCEQMGFSGRGSSELTYPNPNTSQGGNAGKSPT